MSLKTKGIMAAAVIICSSCAPKVTLRSYDIPKEAEYIFPFIDDDVTEEDLSMMINDVAASGFIDRSYIRSLDGISYTLRLTEKKEYSGVRKSDRNIDLCIGRIPDGMDHGFMGRLFSSTLILSIAFHEFGHDYFWNELTHEEKDAFRTSFIECLKDYDVLSKLEALKSSPLPDALYQRFGLTKGSYYAIRHFIQEEDFYRKWYGTEERFQALYYSSQAFADLFSSEMTNKFMGLNELLAEQIKPGILSAADIESAKEDVRTLKCIPESLHKYYSGLIRQDVMNGNVNVDELLENKRLLTR